MGNPKGENEQPEAVRGAAAREAENRAPRQPVEARASKSAGSTRTLPENRRCGDSPNSVPDAKTRQSHVQNEKTTQTVGAEQRIQIIGHRLQKARGTLRTGSHVCPASPGPVTPRALG